MANLDWYATLDDHRPFLTWLLEDQPDLRVMESYSGYDSDLRTFATVEQILDYTAAAVGSALFQLWLPEATEIRIRRYKLNPSTGHSFRHCVNGWGLMQLYLGRAAPQGILLSHFGHFEPRGAERSAVGSDLATPLPTAGQWALLKRRSGRLMRHLRKMSVAKVGYGPWPILPGAECLRAAGLPICSQGDKPIPCSAGVAPQR